MSNFLEKMCRRIDGNACKLAMNGEIAIKTSSGYKTYNVKTNKLTNCSNFVFGLDGMDMFFTIPTNKVAKGDILIINGAPKCVIDVNEDKSIKVINYETSVIETMMPERHVFMGNTYFYCKIVSMFGSNLKGKGTNNIMKYMMMSEMMKGMSGNAGGNNMFPMMLMMNGGGGDFFEGLFGELDTDIDTAVDDEDEDAKEDN